MIKFEHCKLKREGLTEQMNKMIAPLQTELSLNEDSLLFYNVRLAIWEVLCNIIEHSEGNIDNQIDMTLNWTDETITITITDYGKGFKWSECIPEEPPDFTQIGGRGLLMTKTLCDTFTFDREGKTATLIFKYDGQN
ncbi:ATP-binding protein [Bacillus tianshenii]|nr:ATP-binding protein [Bacillus tianshenii]